MIPKQYIASVYEKIAIKYRALNDTNKYDTNSFFKVTSQKLTAYILQILWS